MSASTQPSEQNSTGDSHSSTDSAARPRLTRREAIAVGAALPAVWALGCQGKANHSYDGEIVGASNELGHRLREGFRPRPPAGRWRECSVAIVGAGIAGLSAAWRLKRAGVEDFVLLELEPRAGGTSRGGALQGIPCPWGAHYIPAPLRTNRALIVLLTEMGVIEGTAADGEPVIGEQYLCRDPQERLFVEGSWHEGLFPQSICDAEDLRQLAAFQQEINGWVAQHDAQGRRAFTIPIAACSSDPEFTRLDRQTMSDWLAERKLTSSRLRWLIDYSCRDDYGLTVEQTSAWAGLFYFTSRIRRSGDESQPLISWPEGNGHLAGHLSESVQDKTRVGLTVTEIAPDREHPESGIEVIAAGSSPDEVEGFRAQRVIFAAPQFLAPWLVRGYRDERGKVAAEFEYGSWMVANLSLKSRPEEQSFPLAWDNVMYDSPSLGYVVATHQLGRDHGPTVFTYYYPLCDGDPRRAREKLLSLQWSDCAELALRDLERAHPDLRSLVERVDVMRWGHAMIRPRPGFIWGPARKAAAAPFGAMHFAHSDLSGIALFEEAYYHGNRAAEEVLAARRVKFDSLL